MPLQHKLIGFYNRDEKSLQRGTDWVFKFSSLHLVCKGLIRCTSTMSKAEEEKERKEEMKERKKKKERKININF